MQNVQVDHTRNFAIIGHAGDGKTSLGEAILHRAGATPRLGRVDDGTSVLNHLPEERAGHHTTSVTSHVYAFDWQDHHMTMVDTPGDPNYSGDAELALQALDAVILIVDGVDGVKSGTRRSLDAARARDLPVVAFVNRLDHERADLDTALAALEELDTHPVLLDAPVEDGRAVLDVLHRKVVDAHGQEGPIPPELQDRYAELREALVEAVAESDDTLLERYLEEGFLSDEQIVEGLARGTRSGALTPVLSGSALAELGVDLVLQEVAELLPSPEDRGAWQARAVDDDAVRVVEPREDAELSAVVFKTIIDRYAGTLSVLRIVSGTLEHDSWVHDATTDQRTRIGKLYLLHGEEHEGVDSAGPGDVVAVAKLRDVHTGDVLTCEKHGVHLPEPERSEGVISYAIEAANKKDEEKLFAALARLEDEDPSLHVSRDAGTGEHLVTGMGELHLRTMTRKLERIFGVEAELHAPKVPYRETIQRPVGRVVGKLKKQSGGAGMFGQCSIDLAPAARGAGVTFVDRIVGGAIPRNLIPAVEKGVHEACATGPLGGFPVVDVEVHCVDGKFHSVDSNELAFRLAGSFAMKEALTQARPVLLEPIVHVQIVTPVDRVGDVMGDLASRRGTVQSTDTHGQDTVVLAHVPMSEMLEYAPTLSSLTGGKGEFHMRPDHYAELNGKLAQKVIAEARAAREQSVTA